MPTIDCKEIIDEIIANKGHYEDDPPAILISQYTNDWGKITYHVAYSTSEIASLLTSPYCHEIKVLWQTDEIGIVVI